jgi:ferredoxin-NADP reductase
MSDPMHEARRRAIAARREQVARELRQLADDAEHWNRMRPDEEPIVIDTNLGPDVRARFAALEPFPVSAFVREELDERGWDEARLSDESGISPQRVAAIMAGARLEREDAECLGLAFSVSPDLFVNLGGERPAT